MVYRLYSIVSIGTFQGLAYHENSQNFLWYLFLCGLVPRAFTIIRSASFFGNEQKTKKSITLNRLQETYIFPAFWFVKKWFFKIVQKKLEVWNRILFLHSNSKSTLSTWDDITLRRDFVMKFRLTIFSFLTENFKKHFC